MALRSHCKRNHPLRGDNVKIARDGSGNEVRLCKICHREYHRTRERMVRAGIKPPARMSSTNHTLEEVLASRTAPPNEQGCQLWIGGTIVGYPTLTYQKKSIPVRRHIYEAAHGSIDRNLIVRSTCNEKGCVTLEHLYTAAHALVYNAEHRAKGALMARITLSRDRELVVNEAWKVRDQVRSRLMRKFPRLGAEVDDVMQDALTRMFMVWARGGEVEDPQGYFYTISVRVAVEYNSRVRPASLFGRVSNTAIDIPDPTADFVMQLERAQELHRLMRRMERKGISPGHRRVMKLKIKGFSTDEIVEQTGLAVNTVEHYVKEARRVMIRGEEIIA